ncbi:MAG: hypothetical protein BGP10_12465 [Rhodanobacter sp. 68-29]|nr:hypothetical protein [Rhodanobacter sp.]ODV28000.1 MAG: hypothetical protein ABT19_00385 [Rhodanobacter sp. SCN 68-63]OJY60704.1 MAG: hypothetical protein BGP10_12465 [Rhodanobacter sp. 68-29]
MDQTALFQRATGCTASIAAAWAPPMFDAMAEWHIDTPDDQAAFLAQCGHESMGFRYSAELWGPTPAQVRYERNFDAAWPPTSADNRNRKAYELGNDQQGDGRRFRGHGPIQLTGKANHRAAGIALGLDLVAHPELLDSIDIGCAMSAWWWHTHGLSALANAGEFDRITCAINLGSPNADIGKANGVDDRRRRWAVAKAALVPE